MLQLLQRAKDPNEEESGAGFPNDADDFVAPIPVLKKVIDEEIPLILWFGQNRSVVSAAVEDADNQQSVHGNGECDDHSSPVADES